MAADETLFHLPPAVANARKGSVVDIFPVLSLVACLPTLRLFFLSRRRSDLFIYTVGLLVAILYHVLQVHKPGGLGATSWLGLPGAAWRIIDIICADLMLARSTAHILGINHPFIASLPNIVLPSVLLVMMIVKPGNASLQQFTMFTGGCVLLTIAIQLVVDARAIVRHAVTHYNSTVVTRTVFFCLLGFSCFVAPMRYPGDYWFWHSAWHVCMGLAYFEVYAALCGLPGTGSRRSHLGAQQHGDKGASLQGRRHWMASSHANGEPPLAECAICGTCAKQELAGSPAGNAEAKPAMLGYDSLDEDARQQWPTSGHGHGRRGSRRQSGGHQAVDAAVPPPAGMHSGRSKSAGKQGGLGGSRDAAKEVATPVSSPPSRGKGKGRGSVSMKAAASGWEGALGMGDEATPPPRVHAQST
eukprot:CAMPEP_0202410336 /NCGR_PEP_ID=MMETSP1128-20130828/18880_1 /ASSEMBLY_ACC=CAM_ASM_000463 /TAXON_ID=3047 /ORGANISM="Dunaliella tertiolecta, Strain CCMP1320" /LENGTH=414 /DNA_ID=CAMNT_0049015833 /DNA_START=256 /DNA_END=1496 /DNA_ORIENTATION=+